MKKILVITTGGTIACKETGNGLAPSQKGGELLKGIEGCEVLDLFACDSTDISAEQWKLLCFAVKRAVVFDGVVILHGTDTMEYTAAMLYYTVSHLNIPVIITGAMLPFGTENSDARRNIRDAVTVARDGRFQGVYAVFGGRIICGNKLVKIDSRLPDAFRSFDGKGCGRIEHGIITPLCYGEIPEPMKIPENDKKIAVIKLTPFTQDLHVAEGYCGAVIESFGAGGIPARLEESLRQLCSRMPVVITTPCIHGTDLTEYEVGQRALNCGAIDGKGMSTACAVVGMWLNITK